VGLLLAACQARPTAELAVQPPAGLRVLAVESFIADMAQNVAGGAGTAGDKLKIETLIPLGIDPHEYELTPQDVAKISASQVLIVNGGGFEGWLQEALDNAGGQRTVIEASAGLEGRSAQEGEVVEPAPEGEEGHEGDPHFWLDPVSVIQYVENIRAGLAEAEPSEAEIYANNAAAYSGQLTELDAWIKSQVAQIPAGRRLLVTNHESFGYFADRYGFKIIGTIIPSVSTGASPSAQQLAQLMDEIEASGAPAIFLETGSNPQLANQIAAETGVKVVTGLYTHSVTPPGGNAPTYIEMMKYNVNAIVEALR
jgi:ABC-type Zn uptake system ZnuABC Zn-binding protein ZnuA